MKYAIGIDIGGTNVAVAVVDETGTIIEQSMLPTEISIPPKEMISKIIKEAHACANRGGIPSANILGVGIGAPGPLDSGAGLITCPPNLPTWVDVPIQKIMEQSFSLPVMLENDANVAAVAEKWLGAAQGHDNFIYMTISTGIGSGVFTDGRLVKGLKGNAGDIGHMVINYLHKEPCICGNFGCLESIASGTAIARDGSKLVGEEMTTKEIFERYSQGDEVIVPYIDQIFLTLGAAAVSLINAFDPEKIVIGGGVSKVGTPLFQAIQDHVSKFALNPVGRQTKIVPAQLNQNPGVIGAAALCFEV